MARFANVKQHLIRFAAQVLLIISKSTVHRVSDALKMVSRKSKVTPTAIDLGDGGLYAARAAGKTRRKFINANLLIWAHKQPCIQESPCFARDNRDIFLTILIRAAVSSKYHHKLVEFPKRGVSGQ